MRIGVEALPWMVAGVFTLGALSCTRPNPAFRESNGAGPGETDSDSSDEGPSCACEAFLPCPDEVASDARGAIGVGCEANPIGSPMQRGAPGSIKLINAVGNSGTYDPTQGARLVALGTGLIDTFLDNSVDCVNSSSNFGEEHALGEMLPPPLIPEDVAGSCATEPSLIGSGDCSNTVEEQFTGGAFDYAEFRFDIEAPQGADGLALDFAFFTSEYPNFIGPTWNDMFIIWLNGEAFTGNIALDAMGNAVSVNTVHLEYKDDDGNLPEFADTCMAGHGATKWLTASGPVHQNQNATVVVAIFDGGDALLDAYAIVDGFRWQCGACL